MISADLAAVFFQERYGRKYLAYRDLMEDPRLWDFVNSSPELFEFDTAFDVVWLKEDQA